MGLPENLITCIPDNRATRAAGVRFRSCFGRYDDGGAIGAVLVVNRTNATSLMKSTLKRMGPSFSISARH